jgi:DNA sulfur modification protein DndC
MRTLFDADRLTVEDALQLTIASLSEYGRTHKHWAIAFSGGKDSTALVTVVVWLIVSGLVQKPESIKVLYADTRMELPPLQICALAILDALRKLGVETQIVLPPIDERFFVYMLGRGVPPPKNKFRWCTPMLKIKPMETQLKMLRDTIGEKFLMLTGVRIGESAVRDQRISLSCSRDGAECGQGWFQEATPAAVADTLAPLLHWRICNVWDWLTERAPGAGFPTAFLIADAYGGKNEMESLADLNGRTGCVGCNLAGRGDNALDRVLRLSHWKHLEPLTRLRPLYAELQLWKNRIRKDGTERRVDGTLVKNPGRVGPLTMDARKFGVRAVLSIQDEVNEAAAKLGRPGMDLINEEELERIKELIELNTWPNGWDGDEISGSEDIPDYYADGTVQPLLFRKEGAA